MNETEIVKQVAKNVPKEEPQQSAPVQNTTPEGPDALHSNVELNDPVIRQRFSDHFELSRAQRWDETVQKQLDSVLKYAQHKVGTDQHDVLGFLRGIEVELGISFKPNKLQTIHRFIQLKKQSEYIAGELGALSGNAQEG